MDTGLITRIIGEIVDAGCLWLLLTGGEPLIRSDFRNIYLEAKKRGILVTLFTNGTLIDTKAADFLAEWRPSSVEVTLYGATQETYENITRIPGSHKHCMQAIELLLQRKVPLKLKTVAMRQNVHEMPLMREFAESMGLEFRFDTLINARLDHSRGPLSSRLKAEDVLSLDRADDMRWRELEKLCRENADVPGSALLYSCAAGDTSFHIDPYGNLGMCVMARRQSYNLREGRFDRGWSVFLKEVKARRPSAANRCRTCGLLFLCGQCPGWSQVEHGDDETPVAFLCEIAYNRAEALDLRAGKETEEIS